MKYFINFLVILFLFPRIDYSQSKIDSTYQDDTTHFNPKALIIPSALIVYGIIGIESDAIKNSNKDIREEVKEHVKNSFTLDDFTQYGPFASVYALNAFGHKGKHNFKDRTIILGTAYLLVGSTVYLTKTFTHIERPDGSGFNSFPSGHTATAFMGAEFLYQEYKDESIWYGISGYALATFTGLFRMYNNRHWFTDVATGAGIGILSTKIAYWVYPWMKTHIFKDRSGINGVVMPFSNGHQYGFGASFEF